MIRPVDVTQNGFDEQYSYSATFLNNSNFLIVDGLSSLVVEGLNFNAGANFFSLNKIFGQLIIQKCQFWFIYQEE
jgi:hypothetical protein